jgi:hypothetical protein
MEMKYRYSYALNDVRVSNPSVSTQTALIRLSACSRCRPLDQIDHRPFPAPPDGESGIFFEEGLDKFLLICPSGQLVAPLSPHRHGEPTGRANARPMTGPAKQSITPLGG